MAEAIYADQFSGSLCQQPSSTRRICQRRVAASKKETQSYTAHRAAMGGRTLKTGQSRCFVGYKKHTLRLWWRECTSAVMLVPLVSWAAPANVSEGGFLVPSLHYCQQHWLWWPQIVVADMGYLAAEAKATFRKNWRVAVVTQLKSNMNLVPPYVTWDRAECHQGQPLRWLEYAPLEDRHWFGVSGDPTFANAAGERRLASGNSRLLRASTKRSSGCFRWPACPLNGCSSRCAPGSNRPSRMRKTNWA